MMRTKGAFGCGSSGRNLSDNTGLDLKAHQAIDVDGTQALDKFFIPIVWVELDQSYVGIHAFR